MRSLLGWGGQRLHGIRKEKDMSTFLWIVFICLCIWVVIESHQKKKQNQKADIEPPAEGYLTPCDIPEADAEETE